MRSFDGKPEPASAVVAAVCQLLRSMAEAIREVHRPHDEEPGDELQDGEEKEE